MREAEPTVKRLGLSYRQHFFARPELMRALSSGALAAPDETGQTSSDDAASDVATTWLATQADRIARLERLLDERLAADLLTDPTDAMGTGDGGHHPTDPKQSPDALLATLSEDARTLVFMGTGRLMRTAQAIAGFTGWSIPGDQSKSQVKRPRTRFLDVFDPRGIDAMLADGKLETLRFVILGGHEDREDTRLMAVAVLSALQEAGLGDNLARRVVIISGAREPGQARLGLSELAGSLGLPLLAVPAHISDRSAMFTRAIELVGLSRGFDVTAFKAGGREQLAHVSRTRLDRCRALIGALAHFVDVENPVSLNATDTSGTQRPPGGDVTITAHEQHLERLADWWQDLLPWHALVPSAPPTPSIGPGAEPGLERVFGLHTIIRQSPAMIPLLLNDRLLRRADLETHQGQRLGEAGAIYGDKIREIAVQRAPGLVREITLDERSPQALGEVMMHAVIESMIFEALGQPDV